MRNKKRVLIEQGEVNVVSLMDVLTTMLFFLILMASATNFATINSESVVSSSTSNDKKQHFDLAISYKTKRNAKIILGNFNELKVIEMDAFKNYIKNNYKRINKIGYQKNIYAKTTEELNRLIQKEIKSIKSAFPHEESITLAVGNNIKYQEMLVIMEQIMSTSENDYFKITNFIGQTRLIRTLFPNISLQEIGENSAI